MPKVSIVMPVYNGEAYIKEAIDSIIAQTFTDWEFIIVNEYGSNEVVTNILHDYEKQDSRIRVIQNETRLRIAESLNVGLRAANGEYIARMDADDISGKDRILNQVKYLDEHKEIDICGMKVDMFGESTWDWKVYSDPEYLRCSCLFYTPFIHPTIMMRSSSIRKYNLEYDKTFFYTEDYEFFERASHLLNYTNLEIPKSYHYRYLSTNATNVGGNQGLQLQNKVMKSAFERWGLKFTNDEIRILSPNTYPYAQSVEQAQDILEQLDLLLKEVFLCDTLRDKFGIDLLYQVLHRRWMDAFEAVRWRSEIMDDGQIQRAIDRGFFRREKFYLPNKISVSPRVSVVIPTYNSESYVMDTLWSILEQDYTQFEVLIMNEYGSDDRTKKCVELFKDERIKFIQNSTKLGLAKSLNLGFQIAKGEYIARADADDVYPSDRLRKQVEFLDNHPEIDVCGTWQRHFGKRNYIHKPATTKEEMRVNLIFKCDVCHSTVMLRRDKFISLDIIYDDTYLSEDFELWSRVSPNMWFATIPEVLGEYRWNGENITAKKMDMLDIEAQKLVRRNLYNTLGLEIPDEDLVLLSGWKNPFMDETNDVKQLRSREDVLLNEIEDKNNQISILDKKALSSFIYERKVWAGIEKESVIKSISSSCELEHNSKGILKKMLKKIIKPLYKPFRIRYENRLIGIQESIWRQDGMLGGIEKTIHDVDGHMYDYYHRLEVKIEQQDEYIKQMQSLVKDMIQELKSIRLDITTSQNSVIQAVDGRIYQAEQLINQTTDGRIYQAEQLINQTTDTRVWNAEKLINQTTDTRVWNAEKLINQTVDSKTWMLENKIISSYMKLDKDSYEMKRELAQNKNRYIDILFANDTFNTYHHGSSATSKAILNKLESTGKNIGILPMPLLCNDVSIFPLTVDDFISDEFFEIWSENNHKLIDYIEKSKSIVINGEGCITQYCAGTLNLLYFAYISKKRYNINCRIINHSLCIRNGIYTQIKENIYTNEMKFRQIIKLVYSEMDFVALRECKSLEVLNEIIPNVGVLSFDCILLYIKNQYTPKISEERYITISGGNSITEKNVEQLAYVICEIKKKYENAKICFLFSDIPMADTTTDLQVYDKLNNLCQTEIELMTVRTTDSWLDCILNSIIVISGRFHHSLAAYMLDRPFIAFSPDIHKLQSAIEMMGCEENMLSSELTKEDILRKVISLCDSVGNYEYDKNVKNKLVELCERNFEGI